MTAEEAFKQADCHTDVGVAPVSPIARFGNPTAFAMPLVDGRHFTCCAVVQKNGREDRFPPPLNVNYIMTDNFVCHFYDWERADCSTIWERLEAFLHNTYPEARAVGLFERRSYKRTHKNGQVLYGFIMALLLPDSNKGTAAPHKCNCPRQVLFAQGCQCGGV